MKREASTRIGGARVARKPPNSSSITARLPAYFLDHCVVPVIVQLKSSAMLSTKGREFPFASSAKMCCISSLFSVASITHFSFFFLVSAASSVRRVLVCGLLPAIVHRNRSCDRSVPVLATIQRSLLPRGCDVQQGFPFFAPWCCCLALPMPHTRGSGQWTCLCASTGG